MKNLFKTVMVLALVGIIFGQSADNLLNDGIARLNAGDLVQAEELLMQALEQDPGLAAAMVQLAKVNIRKGKMELTQQYLRQAIDSDPSNAEYREEFTRVNDINTSMAEGSRALNSGLFADAFNAYKSVNDNFPFFPEAVYSMGLVKFREKEFTTAAEYFHKLRLPTLRAIRLMMAIMPIVVVILKQHWLIIKMFLKLMRPFIRLIIKLVSLKLDLAIYRPLLIFIINPWK